MLIICLRQMRSVTVAGSEGSGKSTLVAVLSNGKNGHPILDSGYGSARMMTLRHKHEIESGKTSSLGHHTIAYDRDKRVLNYAGIAPLLPSEIAESADCVRTPLTKFICAGTCIQTNLLDFFWHAISQSELFSDLSLNIYTKTSRSRLIFQIVRSSKRRILWKS